ncbi:hypothetical protein ACWEFL_15750 [Streptomyces sp. NPDC004838]
MSTPERRPLPAESAECRQNAEQLLPESPAALTARVGAAAVWALLAIAGELREIRGLLRKR